MATLTITDMRPGEEVTATVTTLGASDTFAYANGGEMLLIMNNVTGGALTPNIDGDGAGTIAVSGVGDVDISGGFDFPSIGAGVTMAVRLDSIKHYLPGTIAMTGGTGIEATLMRF